MADTIVTVCAIVAIICGILSIRFSVQATRYGRLAAKILTGEPLTAKEQKLRETLPSYREEEE